MAEEAPAKKLTEETLEHLRPDVETPDYDREALTPAVVHLSVGGFGRAHQLVYFDDLAQTGEDGWGVVGVGMRSPEMGMVLSDQDSLYTVVEHGPAGGKARVIGSMIDYLYYPDQPREVLEILCAPSTRLVTMTVTGEGYRPARSDDPDLRAHRSGAGAPQSPAGVIVHALHSRRMHGTEPFTVLSCDNLDDSGAAARAAVLSYAGLLDADLAQWIAEHVSFPSSMVDRITPSTSPRLRDEIEMLYGVPDRWPVVTESFRQWVIQDDFVGERPPLERVGVQFVDDVTPYKTIKSRMLNGAHLALGYLGVVQGMRTTAEAMADPHLGAFLRRLLAEEVRPLLPQPAGVDLEEYYADTVARLANPDMEDQLIRLCRRGSTKVPYHLLSSLREAKESGRPHRMLTIAVAGWLRFLNGVDERGETMTVQDARADELIPLAAAAAEDARPLLAMRDIFGDLAEDEDLARELDETLTDIYTRGARAVLESALEHHGAPATAMVRK